MSLTESTILFGFHSVWMSFLVFCRVVITILAFCTCQCDLCAHDFHLHLYYRSSHLPLRYLFLRIKKRPKLFHSPDYYTIQMSIRQGFLGLFSALVYFKNIQKFLFVCSVIVCDFLYGIHMQFFAIVPIISLKYVSAYKKIFTNRRTLIMMDIEGRQLRNS